MVRGVGGGYVSRSEDEEQEEDVTWSRSCVAQSFTNQFVEVEGKGVTEAGVATRYHHRLAWRRHLRQVS